MMDQTKDCYRAQTNLLLLSETMLAKEDMIYICLLRKTSRLNVKKGLQCGFNRQSSHNMNKNKFLFAGNRLAFFLKGNRPLWRQRVENGEIQLDLKPQGLLFLQPS
jgi:hypothetical protein